MSVTRPKGFVAAGVACGIKASGALDLALVATDDGRPVPAAAVFTTNKATAAPVQVSRRHLETTHGNAAAVVVSSGNANAATGPPGMADARHICDHVATALGLGRAEEVLICQTGLIGIPLPMDAFDKGIPALADARAATAEAAATAAQAIMTTDTVLKTVVVVGDGFTVGGMAKGAAMLAPDMATMLSVLTTDAAATPAELHQALTAAVDASFNTISIDGCTSTNDTVVLLASGRAAPASTAPHDALTNALTAACHSLAQQMVADAEGATRSARITVSGAVTDHDAHLAARKVVESLLVKSSLNGADPYWGRIVSELGSAGVAFDLDRVQIAYGGTVVAAHGMAAPHDSAAVRAHLEGRHVDITCDLGLGTGTAAVYGTDLGYGYLDENRTTS